MEKYCEACGMPLTKKEASFVKVSIHQKSNYSNIFYFMI